MRYAPAAALVVACCAIASADDHDLCPTQMGLKYGQADRPSRVEARHKELKKLERALPSGWRLWKQFEDRRVLLVVAGPTGSISYPIGPSWTRARAAFDRVVAEEERRAKREADVLPTIDSVHDAPSISYPMIPHRPRCEIGALSVYAPYTEGSVSAEDERRIHRLVDRHCKRVRGK
jgi:hypothetical protein